MDTHVQGSGRVWLELSTGQGKEGTFSRRSPPVPTPPVAPAFPQVVAVDLDEGPNGLVSYRMQVAMPRMDFLINSSSGVVVTAAELDRERVAEYQLRVVASDAGTPTKSSTSTLTIRGEGRGCCRPCGRRMGPGAAPGGLGRPRPPALLSPSRWTQGALLMGYLPQPCYWAVFFASAMSKMPAEPSVPSPGLGAWIHLQGPRLLLASLIPVNNRDDLPWGGQWVPQS